MAAELFPPEEMMEEEIIFGYLHVFADAYHAQPRYTAARESAHRSFEIAVLWWADIVGRNNEYDQVYNELAEIFDMVPLPITTEKWNRHFCFVVWPHINVGKYKEPESYQEMVARLANGEYTHDISIQSVQKMAN